MKLKYILFLIIILLFSCKSNEKERIKGTNVYMKIPEDYKWYNFYNMYYKKPMETISVISFYKSYSEVKNKFNPNILNVPGVEILKKEAFDNNKFLIKYKASKFNEIINYFFIIGDTSECTILECVVNPKISNDIETVIENSFKGSYISKKKKEYISEVLFYDISESNGLELISFEGSHFFYTLDKLSYDESKIRFRIGGYKLGNNTDIEKYAKIESYIENIKLINQTIHNKKISNQDSVEIISEYEENSDKRYRYSVAFNYEGFTISITGDIFGEDNSEYIETFSKISESLKIKDNLFPLGL